MECLTYRWYGHHEGDPGVAYRTKEEIAAWKERDPVKNLKDDAIAAKQLSKEDFDRVDTEVAAVLEEAAQFALASPLEQEATALRYVFHRLRIDKGRRPCLRPTWPFHPRSKIPLRISASSPTPRLVWKASAKR